ncbi:MAG: 4-(cytidine 5'-diphospho)-2-C-methyl-D-erythritol kinase, partial [Ginsengibacter sp.]
SKSIKEIIHQPISTWKRELINDFEKPIFIKYPEIKAIKDALYNDGAVYASMSGSGSSVFGIFEKQAEPAYIAPVNYFYKIMQTL